MLPLHLTILHEQQRNQQLNSAFRQTLDRRTETLREKKRFAHVRRAENEYARALRSVARRVGELVRRIAFGLDPATAAPLVAEALRRYALALSPWARATAARMLADVSRRDESAWAQMAQSMTRALREEIRHAPTGDLLREMLDENVKLITSLPLEAAERVHNVAIGNLYSGLRGKELSKEIMKTGEVTQARANLIARTETARVATGLVEARAKFVGSDGYVWQTSRDSDVRDSHRRMQGKFVRWDHPPTLDGLTGHAGQLPNCRCWPDPVVPEEV